MKNVMGIIIAVIGLAIFFAGVYGLYQINKSQEIENAKNLIDSIVGKIENLQDGENNTFTFTWVKGWRILGYDLDTRPRPDKCFFNNCLCICRAYGNILAQDYLEQGQVDLCQNEGFCKDLGEYKPEVLIRNQWLYYGKTCKWKSSGEPVISDGKRGVLHHEGTDEGSLVEIEILKEQGKVVIGKITYKDIGENSLLRISASFASNIETNKQTRECYFE